MSELHRILSSKRKGLVQEVQLQAVETAEVSSLTLSPYIYLSQEYDTLEIDRDASGSINAIRKIIKPFADAPSEHALVFPYYSEIESVELAPGFKMEVEFTEITSAEEFQQLGYLEQFHYLKAKPTWGRQMYLIARPTRTRVMGTPLPPVVGCVVLSSPSLLSGPRNRLFGWTDRKVLSENIDRVVRIARVITHPEFRGLRLGSLLTKHAIQYCRERWNVKGKAAWAVETVAEMSRYHPFFERGGLRYIGDTNRQEKAFFFDTESKSLGIDQGAGNVMASLKRFKQKVHTPKPVLMIAFRDDLQQLIEAEAAKHTLVAPVVLPVPPQLEVPILLENVSVTYHRTSVWDEPKALQKKWFETAELSGNDVMRYVLGIKLMLDEVQNTLKGLKPEGAPPYDDKLECLPMHFSSMEKLLRAYTESVAELQSGVRRGLDGLQKSLPGLDHERLAVSGALQSLIDQTETDLRPLAETEERLPPDMVKLRNALNDLRVKLMDIRDRFAMGSVSKHQVWVRDAFGVEPNQSSTVFNGLNIEILPGQIVMVVGPSGSGKSTLLSVLQGQKEVEAGRVWPDNLPNCIGSLDLHFDPSIPLIDLARADLSESIHLLNSVGLAESHLYLKRRDELSHGQRYRAGFAKLLSLRKQIWLADEFCAFLDPVTTVILCKGLRRLVKENGITFIAAAAKDDHVESALLPDLVLHVNAGGQVTPNPQVQHWPALEGWGQVLGALREQPDNIDQRVAGWLVKIGLIKPSVTPGQRHERTPQLQEWLALPDGALQARVRDHLWETDWYYHRMRNRERHSGMSVSDVNWWVSYLGGVQKGQVQSRLRLL